MKCEVMSTCRIEDQQTGAVETAGYLDCEGDQLYFVRHHARQAEGGTRGSIVLCGTIGAQRERAYRTMVETARLMAARGFEVVRFDYRGIGESGGRFERMCLSDWKRDVEACAALLREDAPGMPMALWGVRAGALLASECFAEGMGDALMLCAPMSGRTMLSDILRRTLVAEMLSRPNAPRTTAEECQEKLKRGELVNVDGYWWSGRLWDDAERHPLVLPGEGESRPWRVMDLKGAPKTEMPAWAQDKRVMEMTDQFWELNAVLVPRSMEFVERGVEWLRSEMRTGGRSRCV